MNGRGARGRTRWLDIAREEWAPVGWATGWFFFLMTGYYMLRPLRETAGTLFDAQRGELRWAFYGTFVGILVWLAVYTALAARLPRRRLVASVHHVAALVQLALWATYREFDTRPVAYLTLLYVWISILGLFCVAVVWSALADIFSKEQSERLFGPIAVGATLGGLAGSAAMPWVVQWIGFRGSLLAPLVLFEVSLVCQRQLDRWALRRRATTAEVEAPPAAHESPLTGLVDAGLRVVRSPYLFMIGLHLLVHALLGTAVYLLINDFVAAEVKPLEQRTMLFANVNWYTQLATLPMQAIGMHWLIAALGVPLSMCLLPLVYLLAFAGLAWQPALLWLLAVDVARRTMTYGLESPLRAVLFTVTSRDDKYRTKGFLDTFVVRGGEAASQEVVRSLRAALGSQSMLAGILAVAAVGWIGIGYGLGRAYQRARPQD